MILVDLFELVSGGVEGLLEGRRGEVRGRGGLGWIGRVRESWMGSESG